MKIILVRHGESEANKAGKHQGKGDKWTNTSLTEKGKQQAKKVAERLKKEEIEIIYSSPLKRAKETAESINRNHNLEIIYDKRLKEKMDETDTEKFISEVKSFYGEINKKHTGTVIITAHGMINLTLLAISTGCRKKGGKLVKKYPKGLDNTSISIIGIENGKVRRHRINCIKHLK
jgi:broad specificity phosphatase PhoE